MGEADVEVQDQLRERGAEVEQGERLADAVVDACLGRGG